MRRGPPGARLAAALAGLAALAPGGVARAEPAGRSGLYEGLTLAVAGTGVAGVFAEERGGVDGRPSFRCLFLLRGRLAEGRAAVETWLPGAAERIPGTLAFTPEGAALTLAEDHGGCGMTTGTMVGKPYPLTREAGEPAEGWQGVALVTARRARLRPEPGPAPERGPYLVAHDPVAVLERREGWARVRYHGGKAPVAGWLPAADLAVAMP